MSMQHTGDGPPGNDNYYDMEDMEANRATGRRRNPNATAWDPEKMELHRIVNRLLALEERTAVAARPVEHAVSHKVKLPGFWEKGAAAWFRLAKAIMEDNPVVNPQVMYSIGRCSYTSRTTRWRGQEALSSWPTLQDILSQS